MAHLLFRVDEPVACDDETGMNIDGRLLTFELLSECQQAGISLETGRHSLYLPILGGVIDGLAAIDIVIAEFRTDDDILHIDIIAVATGTTRQMMTSG